VITGVASREGGRTTLAKNMVASEAERMEALVVESWFD